MQSPRHRKRESRNLTGKTANNPDTPNFAERRELTALFYDLVDSTSLLNRLDLEDYQELISSFQTYVSQAVQRHGGTVREILGDGGMVLFGYPTPSDLPALSAIEAAIDILSGLQEFSQRNGTEALALRIGIATSEVVIDDLKPGERDVNVIGLGPTLAARIQAFATPNAFLVCDKTYRLTRWHFRFEDWGLQELKGFSDAQRVWRVKEVRNRTGHFFGSVDTTLPIVGRLTELETVDRAWKRARKGHGQLILIEGEAGVGKTRLIHEIRRKTRTSRSRLLMFQCLFQGQRRALHPIVNQLLAFAAPEGKTGTRVSELVKLTLAKQGIEDSETIDFLTSLVLANDQLEESISSPSAGQIRQRIFHAVCECINTWLRDGPIVIVVEDIDWIDPTSADLLEDLCGWIKDKSLLLIATSRSRTDQFLTGLEFERIFLKPLQNSDAKALARNILKRKRHINLDETVLNEICKKSKGMPIYLEHILNLARIDEFNNIDYIYKTLKNENFTKFQNILLAKIQILDGVKAVAYAAAVIGQEFSIGLIRDVVGTGREASVEKAIDQLVTADLIVSNDIGSTKFYRFRHSFVQETLYSLLVRRSRQGLHRRVFQSVIDNPDLVPWADTLWLAQQAEHGDLKEEAVTYYVLAARENSSKYAVREARELLETALGLVASIDDADTMDRLKLTAHSALGPILTGTEGTKSPQACRLYDEAVEIARRRPVDERGAWFPIFWGWWYTAKDFAEQRERAQAVVEDYKNVRDPQIDLQLKHCVWAIEFNMGNHAGCITAVDEGIRLYNEEKIGETFTLYGGHDAKVCGLGQKGLSLWFTGKIQAAITSVSACRQWARELGHLGSIAHALDIEAMLLCYRRQFVELQTLASEMKSLAEDYDLRSLQAKALIFDGWCIGHLTDREKGRSLVERGLAIQEEIGTREDFPVYSEMLCDLISMGDNVSDAIGIIERAIEEAEFTGHRYWLAELYRRHAIVLSKSGRPENEILNSLNTCLAVAREQDAKSLLLRGIHTAQQNKLSKAIPAEIRLMVPEVLADIDPDEQLRALADAVVSHPAFVSRGR